jgi:hypothetical protein
MEKFAIGVLLGMVGGAVLTANNYKMRTLVKKSQQEVQAKLDKLMDDKIQDLEEGAKDLADNVKEEVERKTQRKNTATQKAGV